VSSEEEKRGNEVYPHGNDRPALLLGKARLRKVLLSDCELGLI
jgi:hypothetical protein